MQYLTNDGEKIRFLEHSGPDLFCVLEDAGPMFWPAQEAAAEQDRVEHYGPGGSPRKGDQRGQVPRAAQREVRPGPRATAGHSPEGESQSARGKLAAQGLELQVAAEPVRRQWGCQARHREPIRLILQSYQ